MASWKRFHPIRVFWPGNNLPLTNNSWNANKLQVCSKCQKEHFLGLFSDFHKRPVQEFDHWSHQLEVADQLRQQFRRSDQTNVNGGLQIPLFLSDQPASRMIDRKSSRHPHQFLSLELTCRAAQTAVAQEFFKFLIALLQQAADGQQLFPFGAPDAAKDQQLFGAEMKVKRGT